MKNISNIPEKTLSSLVNYFHKSNLVKEVVLYGSRARGTHTDRSDIDLVIRNSRLDRHQLGKLKLDIDNSAIPYMVDLQIYEAIKNPRLRDHIDRVGVVVYSRN
jgi:predicted nucleotidyltransferase